MNTQSSEIIYFTVAKMANAFFSLLRQKKRDISLIWCGSKSLISQNPNDQLDDRNIIDSVFIYSTSQVSSSVFVSGKPIEVGKESLL